VPGGDLEGLRGGKNLGGQREKKEGKSKTKASMNKDQTEGEMEEGGGGYV